MDKDQWQGSALERPVHGVTEAEPDIWQEQAQLPLRERDAMWWASVALPNLLLVAIVIGFVVLVALIFMG